MKNGQLIFGWSGPIVKVKTPEQRQRRRAWERAYYRKRRAIRRKRRETLSNLQAVCQQLVERKELKLKGWTG